MENYTSIVNRIYKHLQDVVNAVITVPTYEKAVTMLYSNDNLRALPPQVVVEMAAVAYWKRPTLRVFDNLIRSYIHYVAPLVLREKMITAGNADGMVDGVDGVEISHATVAFVEQVCGPMYEVTVTASGVWERTYTTTITRQWACNNGAGTAYEVLYRDDMMHEDATFVVEPPVNSAFQDKLLRAIYSNYQPQRYLERIARQFHVMEAGQ